MKKVVKDRFDNSQPKEENNSKGHKNQLKMDANSDSVSDMIFYLSDSEEVIVVPGSAFKSGTNWQEEVESTYVDMKSVHKSILDSHQHFNSHHNASPKPTIHAVFENFKKGRWDALDIPDDNDELSDIDLASEESLYTSIEIQEEKIGEICQQDSPRSLSSTIESQKVMDSDYFSLTESGLTASQRAPISSRTAGTIHKIQMRNFMCHDNLEVKLNPRVNFIIGKNGSGKSAIQTAIAIGLGGKALATNRGSSIKALIKNDKTSCTISIVINNQGESAYKPDVYGNYIKVERTFSQTAGSYKIRSSDNTVVSTERKEVDKIVNHFNIQPENPLCILQQDMARNFLNSSDPKKKYTFYMKASRLGDISRLYNESTCRVHTIREILDAKFQSVEDAFRDVLQMRENLKVMEEARHKREKCAQLEKELLWAEVNECNLELKRLQKRFESENQEKKKLEQQLTNLQDNNGEEKMRELQAQLKEMDEKVEDARQSLEVAKRTNLEKKDLYSRSLGKFKETRENMISTKKKYECCLDEIKKLVKSAPEIQQRQERLKVELEEQNQELNALKAAEQQADHDKRQLIDTVDVTRQNLQSCEQKLAMLSGKKRKTADQIKHLTQSTSNLSIYGEAIVTIVEEIEKAVRQGKFQKKPIGPIGRHISVRDPKWAAAVENYLNKGFLSSFCVDNAKDSQVLSDIMKRPCSRYNTPTPPIICSSFLPQMHNISRHETGTTQYSNLVRALDIDNPVVANCLIDQQEAETVLLIPSNKEAYQLLDEEHKVPRNCRRAFTLTGDQFIPAPNYKSYSAMRAVTRATLLQARQEDLIRELTNEVKRLSEEICQVEEEKKTVQHQLGDISTSMRKTEAELRNLRHRRLDVEQKIKQVKDELSDTDSRTNIGFLEEESQELKRQYESESEKCESMKSDCERAKAEFEEARSLYEKYKSTIDESNRQKAPIQGEIQRLKAIMNEASSKVDIIKHRMRDNTSRMEKIEKDITEVKKELASSRANASQTCDEEVETNRSKEDIERELNAVKTYLKKLEEKLGGSEEVLQNSLKKRQEAFDAVTQNLNELRSLVKKSQDALRGRRLKQTRLQRIMMSSAKHNFQIALKERNFEGKLEFDVMNETLEIKVSRPQHNEGGDGSGKRLDTSSLSGGEKSYSTVCFIMALWNEVELPFHFMDEFDVFMDGINRKVVIDMLLGHARNINQQFVFLTPLDASSIPENDNITIHRLAAPRK